MPPIKTTLIASSVFILVLLNMSLYNPYDASDLYVPVNEKTHSDTILSGKQLAAIYCKICHQFPEPALLDKNTWVDNVLPNMAFRMGIKKPGENPFKGIAKEEVEIIRHLGVYPDSPLLSDNQWSKIVEYYKSEAPNEPLEQNIETAIVDGLPLFKSKEIFIEEKSFPMTTMLKFDNQTSQLYVGDATNTVYMLNNKLKLKKKWKVSSAPVDIDFPIDNSPRILTIGIFTPSDQKIGELKQLQNKNNDSNQEINLKNLPRPVNFTSGDLNMDSHEDAVICGFGNTTGKLFWVDFQTKKEHLLKNAPGARIAEIADFNADGKPDIMVLMAQAREQISIFYNQGNGEFKEKVVLNFSPVYGVSYFELADFNNDGYQDILLTNGDNWDYSPIRKNYHGVRIYLNDGHDNFKNSFFYPMYGASKAMARDFDNDGDLDIAATAFYSGYENLEQSFVYFQNDGNMNFSPFSTPEAAVGKWLAMDVADYDNDGDIDIFLGSYFHSIGELAKLMATGVYSFPQVLVLTNELE